MDLIQTLQELGMRQAVVNQNTHVPDEIYSCLNP
jgi:hypothetical protein